MSTYACTINGSAADISDGFHITSPANGRATLTAQITATSPAGLPAKDQSIVITEDATTIFSGTITALRIGGISGAPTADLWVEIMAADNNAIANRRGMVAQTITAGMTLKQALDVVVAYLPGVTRWTSQPDGPTLAGAVTTSVWRANEWLDYLTKETGWLWRIDNSKILSMYEPGTWTAPFDVIDGDGHTDGDVEVEPQQTDYANRIIVIGAGGITSTASDASASSNPWERIVESPDTTDQTALDALAASILAASLVQLKEVRYSTLQTGILPGMTQTITLAARGVNNTFLVTEVNIEHRGPYAVRRVRAVEGVVYKTGWREQTRDLFGGGGSSGSSLPGVGSGSGTTAIRFAYPLGGSALEFVRDSTPTWVDASPMTVQIDTVPRGTLSADVTVTMRALDAGVTVRARLFDVTAGAACAGTSSLVTSTSWTTTTFTATLTAGSHFYRLQVLPGAADADVAAIGHLL